MPEPDVDTGKAHAEDPADLCARLGVDAARGLSPEEAARRLHISGRNRIAAPERVSGLLILLHQFESPVVWLLAAAAGIAFAFGQGHEGAAILLVLGINTVLGFATELRAARSIEALRELGGRTARVRRDGRARVVPAEELVPGDIVLLAAGDLVSADIRLVCASRVAADESVLTGESMPVEKGVAAVAVAARVADRSSMLFKGTAVTQGDAVGVVVGTGLWTELGRITNLVAAASPARSPIERQLSRLAGQLVVATLVLAVLIVATGIATGRDPVTMVQTAIALGVAAIPEGLPIVATLALARGMWRMAKRNALVERLSAVETLGATTLILTDKTGTLTENRMTVREVGEAPGRSARDVLEIGVLCNDATLDPDTGDPMERAILRAGDAIGLEREALLAAQPEEARHAFDPARRMMATVHATAQGRFRIAAKGAPEAMFAAAVLDPELRRAWHERVGAFAARGLRVIVCGEKLVDDADVHPFEGLELAGLIALEDPPRADVPEALKACAAAGIRVVMVTGDHAATAASIGAEIGLAGGAPAVREGGQLEGIAAGDPRLKTDIFARVDPAEKLALVRAYQAEGEVVAMTGDGVNDAPALKQADIGVAMGGRGTDVARQAAAMILLDDAFPSIVAAIREGRVIFGNIGRFAAYLLSCNLSEVLVVGIAVLTNLPLPLLPLQILYLNLVTDVFPGFALALGEGDEGVMARRPRAPGLPILGRREWRLIVVQGGLLTAATLGAMLAAGARPGAENGETVTVTFLTLGLAQLWHVFDMRHPSTSLWNNEAVRNPWIWGALAGSAGLLILPMQIPPMAAILGLSPPDGATWMLILGMSLAPVATTSIGLHVVSRLRARTA